jgi:hypothetical protein
MSATKVRNSNTRLIVFGRDRFTRLMRWLAERPSPQGGFRDEIARRLTPPRWVLPPFREPWSRRAARRLLDERLAAFHALPPEEQIGYVHPASPNKPPGWTL